MEQLKYRPAYHGSFALVIGINEYLHASPLEIARADAESVRDVLSKDLGFPPDNVSVLLDTDATRSRIMERFLTFECLDADDRLLVFFAGHGTTVQGSRGNIGYLVPVDGSLGDKSTLIRWDDLTRNADIIPAKHILFIMDACYSGLAIQRAGQPGEQRFVADMMQRASRQVITAGKADEVVADGGGPTGNNSIFTGHLLKGLTGAASTESGIITASALMNYTYRRVSSDSRSNQTPHFGHIDGDGDFILRMPDDDSLKVGLTTDFLVKTVAERPETPAILDNTLPSVGYLEKRGYANPEDPAFGRNEWTSNLGTFSWTAGNLKSWLSLVIEPVSNEPIRLDLATLAKSLPGKRITDDLPQKTFGFPSQANTTAKSLVLFEPVPTPPQAKEQYWFRFMRIEQNGGIEFCEFEQVARLVTLDRDSPTSHPIFLYVQLIGTIWTFLNAAKHILDSAGYTAGIRYVVNVIGTKGTFLADYSAGTGKDNQKWRDPFNDPWGMGDALTKFECSDLNLQFPFKLVIGALTDDHAKKIVWDCAEQFTLAYNHQSAPRCFNYGTNEFPWKQYAARR